MVRLVEAYLLPNPTQLELLNGLRWNRLVGRWFLDNHLNKPAL